MDHSLGALLVQNNDQGHEQAIYYLSRTMIGDEHHYNSIEKEFSFGLRCSEDATLSYGPDHSRHLESQSIEITYDEAIVTE